MRHTLVGELRGLCGFFAHMRRGLAIIEMNKEFTNPGPWRSGIIPHIAIK